MRSDFSAAVEPGRRPDDRGAASSARHTRPASSGSMLARLPQRLGHRPPHVGLAVGHAATLEHACASCSHAAIVGQLLGQAALADAGLAHHSTSCGAAARSTAVVSAWRSSPSSCSRPTSGACDRRGGGPGGASASMAIHAVDRLLATLDLTVAERARSASTRGVAAWVAGPTTTWPGAAMRLQAAGDVHDVAHRRVVAAGAQRADQHLAGVDADAHAHVDAESSAVAGERALHLQRGPHGALGVVLVGDRRAEQRDDRVADDLVDPAAEGGDVGRRAARSTGRRGSSPARGRASRDMRGEADEVGEQHVTTAPLVGAARCRAWPHDGQKRALSGNPSPARRARHLKDNRGGLFGPFFRRLATLCGACVRRHRRRGPGRRVVVDAMGSVVGVGLGGRRRLSRTSLANVVVVSLVVVVVGNRRRHTCNRQPERVGRRGEEGPRPLARERDAHRVGEDRGRKRLRPSPIARGRSSSARWLRDDPPTPRSQVAA